MIHLHKLHTLLRVARLLHSNQLGHWHTQWLHSQTEKNLKGEWCNLTNEFAILDKLPGKVNAKTIHRPRTPFASLLELKSLFDPVGIWTPSTTGYRRQHPPCRPAMLQWSHIWCTVLKLLRLSVYKNLNFSFHFNSVLLKNGSCLASICGQLLRKKVKLELINESSQLYFQLYKRPSESAPQKIYTFSGINTKKNKKNLLPVFFSFVFLSVPNRRWKSSLVGISIQHAKHKGWPPFVPAKSSFYAC